MTKYFILFTLILIGCKNTPKEAATKYCNCLQKRLEIGSPNSKADSMEAFVKCDSEIAMQYEELYTIYEEKNPSPSKWDSAIKFEIEFSKLRQKNCCSLIGNCFIDRPNFLDSLRKIYSSYIINENLAPIDLIDSTFKNDSTIQLSKNHNVTENVKLISVNKDGLDSSTFYYEIVEFNNKSDLNYIIMKLKYLNNLRRSDSKFMAFKKITEKRILICVYERFDYNKMRTIINHSFGGLPIQSLDHI